MLERLLPSGQSQWSVHPAALWLLGVVAVLKAVIGFNSVVFTRTVAAGADGLPLDRMSPEAAAGLMRTFAILGTWQISAALLCAAVLIRYRHLVGPTCLLLLLQQIAARFVGAPLSTAVFANTPGFWINMLQLVLLISVLVISLRGVSRAGPLGV